MKTVRVLSGVAACVVLAGVTASALGATPSLVSIGALTPGTGGTTESRIYALSPDGAWAVGYSNGQDALGGPLTQAVVWSTGSGLVQLPNTTNSPTVAKGIAILPNGDLGIAGIYLDIADTVATVPTMHTYTVASSNLTGGTWIESPGSNGGNRTIGTYNAARLRAGTSDWMVSGQRGSTGRGVGVQVVANSYSDYRGPAGNGFCNSPSGFPYATSGGTVGVLSAGYDNGLPGGRRAVLLSSINGTGGTAVPGGSGHRSEALGISPATSTVAGSGALVGYDQDLSTDHFPHAFYWKVGDAAMTILAEPAGDNQSTAIDVKMIGSDLVIGGYSSDGTTEKAVLWNQAGQPMLLSALLSSAGVDISGWSSLSRITSLSDDGKTVAGWGIWAADGSTRGFVATVPEPATLMLAFAALPLLLRRRR